jgi:hypothetical protein
MNINELHPGSSVIAIQLSACAKGTAAKMYLVRVIRDNLHPMMGAAAKHCRDVVTEANQTQGTPQANAAMLSYQLSYQLLRSGTHMRQHQQQALLVLACSSLGACRVEDLELELCFFISSALQLPTAKFASLWWRCEVEDMNHHSSTHQEVQSPAG